MANRTKLLTGAGLAFGSMFSGQLGAAMSVPLMLSEGAFSSTALRLVCAAAVAYVWARPNFLSFSARQWRSAIALGLVMAFMTMCFFAATTRIPVGAAITIDFLGPLAVAALSLKGLRRIALPLLAAAGVFAMTYSREGLLFDPVGMLLALAAALGWGSYIVLMRHVGSLFSEQEGLSVALIIAALAALPVAIAIEPSSHVTTQILSVAGLALLSPLVPFALEMMALRRMPVGPFSILMSLEPAFGALLGYMILGQELSERQLAGILAVMIASIAAVMLSSDAKAREHGA
ncbi:MAG: EamA family transporter [Hyphomicrobium sp.]